VPADPKPSRHSFEDHTSEVELRLEAPTLEELFVEAGRALAELYTGRQVAQGESQTVVVRANDRASLLVEWLNELIYRAEVSRQVATEFRIDHLSSGELSASIRGPATQLQHTPVKAATMHGVKISEEPNGFSASVILDV
jgi:SHS2 domain-containing protein